MLRVLFSRFVSPLTPRRTIGLAALLSPTLWACDPPLPSGYYSPEDLTVEEVADDGGRTLADATITVTLGNGQADAGTSNPGGPDAAVVAQTPLAQQLSGDYWVRVEVINTSSGAGLTVKTTATTYLVAKVGVDTDGKLKMVDRQCALNFAQSGATTTIPVAGQQSRYPAKRIFTIDPASNKWSTAPAYYAMGWEYDYANNPDRAPPTSDSDPLVYDPDGGGNGINVTVKATVTCNLRIVQKVAFAFAGTVTNGEFGVGSVDSDGSQQEVLKKDALCPSDATKLSGGPDTIRFVRATVDQNLTCPTESQFAAKF